MVNACRAIAIGLLPVREDLPAMDIADAFAESFGTEVARIGARTTKQL